MPSKHQRKPKTQAPNPDKIPNHRFPIRGFQQGFLRFGFSSFFGFWICGFGISFGAPLSVVGLRCEYLESPLGLDEPHPRLSWRLESTQRGERQTAYEILVASELGKIDSPDLWDSEKITNSQ